MNRANARASRAVAVLIAATVALAVAFGGSAFAAHYHAVEHQPKNLHTKKHHKKHHHKPKPSSIAGLPGPTGPTGPAGAPGGQGPQGPQGPSNPSATTVDGQTLTNINDKIAVGQTSFAAFYSADGLTLSEECTAPTNNYLGIDFQSSDPNAELNVTGYDPRDKFAASPSVPLPASPYGLVDYAVSSTPQALFYTNPGTNEGSAVLSYANTSGQTVTVDLGFDYGGAFNSTTGCAVWGTAFASS